MNMRESKVRLLIGLDLLVGIVFNIIGVYLLYIDTSAPWFSYPVMVISVWGIVFWAIYDTNKNKHRGDTVVKIKKKGKKQKEDSICSS